MAGHIRRAGISWAGSFACLGRPRPLGQPFGPPSPSLCAQLCLPLFWQRRERVFAIVYRAFASFESSSIFSLPLYSSDSLSHSHSYPRRVFDRSVAIYVRGSALMSLSEGSSVGSEETQSNFAQIVPVFMLILSLSDCLAGLAPVR